MLRSKRLGLVLTATVAALSVNVVGSAVETGPCLGINLAGPADWNTELPLRDAFRFSRVWISQRQGAGWGAGPELKLDERGWVTQLEPGCWAETPLLTNCTGAVPIGEWTILYDGTGTIELWGEKVSSRPDGPGRILLTLRESNGFFLRLTATDPANYVRNIRVLPPGVTPEQVAEQPWNPNFLRRWKGVRCLRFMDFMHTNNSKVHAWEQRPLVADATWSHGLPLELMCDLANRLHADPWFCIPHQADDDYVRQFAKQAKELLEPQRTVWIEYSNEVWNSQFEQHRYAAEQGRKLGFADKPWEAAWRFTSYRSVQIFEIWEEVFGGTDRLQRVLASQAANSHVSDQICEFRDAFRHADVLAIAPYVSFNVSANEAERVVELGLEAALRRMEQESLPECIQWMRAQKSSADRWKLRLAAYEGGQHMVGIGGAENNEALTKMLHAANRHERMGGIYRQYLQAWTDAGGDLFCAFSSVGAWSKWGSWGLMQRDGEDPGDYPKFLATMQWARSLGQPVRRASQGSPAMEARPVHRASQGSPAMEARPVQPQP